MALMHDIERLLVKLKLSSDSDIIELLLKPLNFDNYINKFKIRGYLFVENDIIVRLAANDYSVLISSKISDGKVIWGHIQYNTCSFQGYSINNINKAEFDGKSISVLFNLDIIKRKLRNL